MFSLMYVDVKFDPTKDIQDVVPDMATDISQAFETGVVMDTGIDGDCNEIDDPRNIMGRVESVFEAIDLQRSIGKFAAQSASVAAASAASTTDSVNPSGESS